MVPSIVGGFYGQLETDLGLDGGARVVDYFDEFWVFYQEVPGWVGKCVAMLSYLGYCLNDFRIDLVLVLYLEYLIWVSSLDLQNVVPRRFDLSSLLVVTALPHEIKTSGPTISPFQSVVVVVNFMRRWRWRWGWRRRLRRRLRYVWDWLIFLLVLVGGESNHS